jgi:ribosome-associated protein
MSEPTPVPTQTNGIRLGQFLKLADAVDQGSDAKALLASEAVTVNGVVETRRGRQLAVGDVVGVAHKDYVVAGPEA